MEMTAAGLPNHCRFRISPDTGIALGVTLMDPEDKEIGEPRELTLFRHPDANEMDAYERVLGDAMRDTLDPRLKTGG